MAPRDDDIEDATTQVADDATKLVATEVTPLLPTDLPPSVVPNKTFQHLVLAMCMLVLFVVEIAQFLMDPSSQSILEDVICRDKYPDHLLFSESHAEDVRCKNPDVQKTLALINGWSYSLDMFVPLLVQIPYGMLADKIGRRPILFLSLLGILLTIMWKIMILYFSNTFPVWSVLVGSLGSLVGGGGQMASAMLYTLITDVTPAADRTHSFYLLHAVVLILGVAMKPISALFLNWDPWINMWIGLAAVVLGTALSLLIPETSKLRQEADDRHLRDEVDEPNEPSHFAGTEESTPSSSKDSVLQAAWNEMRDAGIKMGKFVLASKKLMWLMACLACMFPVDSAFTTFLLQYMTKRYNWSWSTATYVSNIGNVTGLAVLIGILPLTSSLLTSRAGLDPLTRDLYLLRASAVCITLGAAFMSFSVTPPIFIVSLVMYSLGQGYFGICRALLIAIVEPHMIATLNTTIGTVQSIVGSVGVPAIGWLVGRGFDWGGLGSGLPYMVVFGITVVMTVALFLWKVPREFEQRQRSD